MITQDERNKVALALRLSGHEVLYVKESRDSFLHWCVSCVVGQEEVELNCRSVDEVFNYFNSQKTPREYFCNTRPHP